MFANRFITKALGRNYNNLNQIHINSSNLLSNYYYLTSLAPSVGISPVLKSNAYGHGIVEVAKILDNTNSPFFCVDSLYEAYELYKKNIKTPILIMGYTDPSNLRFKKLPFLFAVFDKELLSALATYQNHATIHIFVDTGMNREGIKLSDLPDFLIYCLKKSIKVDGLMSHLAEPYKPKSNMTRLQLQNFKKAQDILIQYGFKSKYIHILSSSGLLNNSSYPSEIVGNIARCGLAIYGIDPEGGNQNFKPVLALTTKVIQIKEIYKGEKVGYDGTFTALKKMKIGILPIGYFDGVDRRLSNVGFVRVNNTTCRIIGRISMNITTIDLSSIKRVEVGDKAIVFSSDRTMPNSIYNVAKLCKTIPYDILCSLATNTKRIVI